ncbi:Short-chain dehydrogenase/reductase SDR [Collimonas arenae]|uniref:Short-chain dehydrogenase/reductase SDR n=1 Tax=Collimonas arenae TaxID=279058 RepID=A0A0A1FDH7_9BURK|nr:SDR family oxidoreductase [Collimonas arenae]AIY41830.1 Short-chain dehydrogenase/reductase SDR [Collimonas arenae]
MSGIKDKVVIITGASSGIGEATARVLAANGARVVLGARRTDRLETLAASIRATGGTAIYQALDVTRRSQLEDIVALAKSRFGQVDVIVNNAGVMPLSMLDQLKVDEWDRMVDVNIKGVLYGIAACLPVMQAQGNGQIINLASTGGHRVSPSAAVYCATKFAVRAISEGLRQEVDNIRVTIISPGVTESELADSISDPDAKLRMEIFRKVAISAEAVARTVLFAIEQPEDVDISEILVRPTASPN